MVKIYAFFLSIILILMMSLIIFPGPQLIKTIVLLTIIFIFIFVKQEYLIYISIFTLFFPYPIRYLDNMTNGVIIITIGILATKHILEKRKIISRKLITKNPFFITSLILLFCYMIAIVPPFVNNNAVDIHLKYLMGLICSISFGYIIIGFVDSKERLKKIGVVLLIVLLINLMFGLITLVNPNFVLLSAYFESHSFIGGAGENRSLRLAGLSFKLESYGEYLMIVIVFVFGLLVNLKLKKIYKILLFIILLISSFQLFLNNTRGAIVSTIIGLIILVIINKKYNVIKKSSVAVIGIFILGLAVFAAEMTGYLRVKERFSLITEIEDTKYGLLPAGRAGAWVPAIDKVIKDGFMGTGPSHYPYTKFYTNKGDLAWPHNIILLILSTVGIYGLLAYIFAYSRYLIALKDVKHVYDENIKWLFYSLGVCIFTFSIDALKFDGFLRRPSAFFYFIWLIIALFFCSRNFIEKNENEDNLELKEPS